MIVIIGGGISGTAAAYELAKTGAAVTLVEQGDLASMASGWTLAGVRQSGRHPAELPLAQAAVRRWEHLAAELDADIAYRQDGNLRLALTEDEVPIISEIVEQGQAADLAIDFLPDRNAVWDVAPMLSDRVVAASFCATDGHADPIKTVRALAAAAARHGAVIRTKTRVTAIETDGDRVRGVQTDAGSLAADTVVLAAGIYTGWLCASLGIDLPLTVRHVPVVQTVPLPPVLAPVLGLASAGFAGRQEIGGRLRLSGGSQPWDGANHTADAVQPRAAQVAQTIARAAEIVPAVADARIARVWGGLIDMTPDAIPIIERVPEIDGLVIAAGFSGHGFCLGPITGQILADLAFRGRTDLPIAPFRRARFDGAVTAVAPALHG